jgi:hypothetical protein
MKHVRRRSRTSRPFRLLPAVAIAALALAGAAIASSGNGPLALTTTALAAQQEGRPVAAQKKYRATRPIVADPQGRQRMPTDTEVAQLVDTLSTLTNRPTEGLAETTTATGATVLDLAGGFAGVMLARVNEDGTFETKCVFTFEEGAEFLGLVEIQ